MSYGTFFHSYPIGRHSLHGLQARAAATAASTRIHTRIIASGAWVRSGGEGRRRARYYRPRAPPPRPRSGQGDATGQVHGYRHTDTRWTTDSLYPCAGTHTPLQNMQIFCGGVVTLTCFSYISWGIVNFQVSINVFLNLYCNFCSLAM